MHPLTQTKIEQKERGITIRSLKKERKGTKTEDQLSNTLWSLYKLRNEFRHIHIAYCEVRGKTREQIEIPREDNKPIEDKITRIKEDIIRRIKEHETLRNSS
jgi:hypothetical protein